MLLKTYHGTNFSSAFDIWKNGVNLKKSLSNLDFGKGFYVTDDKQKAINRAFKKTNDYNRRHRTEETPCLVDVTIEDELWINMHTKFFTPREKDWFYFVINNRLSLSYLKSHNIDYHNKDNKYDIVYGEIADGNIAIIADEINNNKIDYDLLDYFSIIPQNGKYYGNQYSFHTEKSLTCIKNISCVIINSRKIKRR